jgi:MFS family permease
MNAIGTKPLWFSWPAWTWGLLLASSTVVLDFFVVLACLGAIETSIGASKAQLQLVLGTYAIANAALLIVGGRLGDLLGRKRTLHVGLGLFALASLGCALAPNPEVLIVFRALQGAAGALMQPQVLGLLSVSFQGASRTRAFDLYAATMGFAAVAAQLIGGALVGLLPADVGWRACFWLSVPLCLASAWWVRGVHDPSTAGVPAAAWAAGHAGPQDQGSGRGAGLMQRLRHIDLVGSGLLGLLLLSLCSALTLGHEQGWPAWSWIAFSVAALCAPALWWWHERGRSLGHHRIIPPGLLSTNRFWLALLTIAAFYAGVASLYFVIALELRDKAGLSPLGTALLLCLMAASFVTASSSRRVKARVGVWWAEIGVGTLACGHLVMWAASTMDTGSPAAQLSVYAVAVLLQGLGIGLIMGQLVGTSLAKVPPQWASVGGGMASTLQQIGNSMGIAGVGLAYLGHDGYVGATGAAVAYFLGLLVVVLVLRRVAIRTGDLR